MNETTTAVWNGEDGSQYKDATRDTIRPPSDFFKDIPPSEAGLHDEDTPLDDPSEEPATANPVPVPHRPQVDAHGRTLNPRSCVTCRKRKVRCDKLHPCNNCNRAHIECVFPSPGRAPRKARKVGEGRDKELLDRLRRLEGVVKGLGVDVPGGTLTPDTAAKASDGHAGEIAHSTTASSEHPSEKPSPEDAEHAENGMTSQRALDHEFREKTNQIEEARQGRFENRFGRLVINEGKSRYINSSFWANLSNEVEDLKGILNQSSDEEDAHSPENVPSLAHQGWIFGFSSQSADLLSLHPLPGQIQQYWATYKDRVDPLVKVLHVPTLEPTVLSAASHLSHLSKGFEVLLFAIYYGAVTSLSVQDCQLKFGEDKTVLLSRYRFGVEQALARANFLTTEEMVVLQAFVIFLICVRRNNDARVIWTLTGLIVRMAQTLGIHRDGSHFGLPPFEVEMRRRLWWQICILDTRASEDHGCDPTIIEQSFDTKMPLNINDVDIGPDMKDWPPERQGCTDISFCLIRCEVSNTFRRINYVPPARASQGFYNSITLEDKEKWITECHQRLEERYLKHCDMSVPLFWVTATVARLMMSKMWLMVYHPFQRQDGGISLPNETKEKLFITSLENIEYAILLETEARTMKWGWLFKTYMQWHALAFMLSELCHRTTGDLVERAWVAVEKTRDGRWGLHMSDDHSRAGHLWRPLKKLYRKAKDARQRGLQEEQLTQQRAANPPSRTYSPNANPMFGHPHRPSVVRAPLSQAQLHRFSEGPTFGQMPLDKHELLKSPRLRQTSGSNEVDPLDSADILMEGVQQPLPQRVSQAHSSNNNNTNPNGSMLPPSSYDNSMLASAASSRAAAGVSSTNTYPFGQNFTNGIGSVDFSGVPLDNNSTTNGNGNGNTQDLMRMNSTDSNNFDLEAAGLMDTSGDLNWENWDQLVRQFGMDMGENGGQVPVNGGSVGAAAGGATAGWNGGQVWDLGGTGAPGGAMGGNLRMGMGMGGGDWF